MKISISALRRSLLRAGVLTVLLNSPFSIAGGLHSAPAKSFLYMHITGNVSADGSCTFANGGNVEVPFGDIHYFTEDGATHLEKTYTQSLDTSLNCTGDVEGDVTFTMTTNSAAVDYQGHKLIPVNIAGNITSDLAIQLLVDEKVQDINTPFSKSIASMPKLKVELVQIGEGKSLVNGASISASATLTLAFL